MVPAAFPRSTPDIPFPEMPTWTPDKQEWNANVRKTADAMIALRVKQWNGELESKGSRTPLWVCVNRYVRKGVREEGKGVTLFFAHANGLHKETWEPTLLELINENRKSHESYIIDEVWSWEGVNHGDSYLVNTERLGGMYDWRDNSRDILHFFLHYMPASCSPNKLPIHLPRLDPTVAEGRRLHGFTSRINVGIGHSLGGCTVTRAAITEPALFSSLILVDPMIRPHPKGELSITPATYQFTVGAIARQIHWPSRDDARKRFLASPFFAAWHPAVLELYLECGLYDDPNGGVSLKTPGKWEAFIFAEGLLAYETWDLIDTLDERIELRWIVSGRNPPDDGDVRERMVWRRPQNASNVVIPSSGHLITQEAPTELAQEIHEFLLRKYGSQVARL